MGCGSTGVGPHPKSLCDFDLSPLGRGDEFKGQRLLQALAFLVDLLQVEAVQFHHLGPGGDKVLHEGMLDIELKGSEPFTLMVSPFSGSCGSGPPLTHDNGPAEISARACESHTVWVAKQGRALTECIFNAYYLHGH